MTARPEPLRDADYERLLAFRTELRDFTRWSEQAANEAGLTPALHQLLLAIRGHGDRSAGPTIGTVAELLHMRHHSAVELSKRAESAQLVTRLHDPDDHRLVRLLLTDLGRSRLEALTRRHLPRIAVLAATLERAAAQAAGPGSSPSPPARG
jgi:DNA-binding MarR family transcriptional regulator